MLSIKKYYISYYSILLLLGTSKVYAFDWNHKFDSIELYAGFGVAGNKLSYRKSSSYSFNSQGSSCIDFSPNCSSLTEDPSLSTTDLISYNKSKSNSRVQLVPSFGISFNKGYYSAAIEASYFIGDIKINNRANNWKTLPTNPSGLGNIEAPIGTPFIISPMGESIDASLNEKFSDIFTLSILPGYQFNDWLKGFAKIGWSTMRFSSNSNDGTRGGAGYFGHSTNYSKRLNGLVLGLGVETRYSGYDFRLEYTRIQYRGFKLHSPELGSTANNTESKVLVDTPSLVYATGNVDFQGQTTTKYKDITSDIVMLSVIKKFDILEDD